MKKFSWRGREDERESNDGRRNQGGLGGKMFQGKEKRVGRGNGTGKEKMC